MQMTNIGHRLAEPIVVRAKGEPEDGHIIPPRHSGLRCGVATSDDYNTDEQERPEQFHNRVFVSSGKEPRFFAQDPPHLQGDAPLTGKPFREFGIFSSAPGLRAAGYREAGPTAEVSAPKRDHSF